MRLNVDDVRKCGLMGKVEVYLDGERVHRCLEADEEEGYVVCYLTGENGELILDPDNHPVPIRLVGEVEIQIRDRAD